METKNKIIQSYANSLLEAANSIVITAGKFSDIEDFNLSIIKTLNILVENVRSQTVIFQSELDNYNKGV